MASLRVGAKEAICFDPSKFVTVIVGKEPDQQRFLVHERWICARSKFFQRAMNGNWAESKERTVRMPEDDPKLFHIYVNLIYTGRVITDTLEELKTAKTIGDELHVLGHLYVLGEKLQDKAAKNTAVQSLLEVAQEKDNRGKVYRPYADTIRHIYQGTCAGSLARRLMAEMWVCIDIVHLTKMSEILPKEFLADLAIALRADRPKHKPELATMANKSRYMEEEDYCLSE